MLLELRQKVALCVVILLNGIESQFFLAILRCLDHSLEDAAATTANQSDHHSLLILATLLYRCFTRILIQLVLDGVLLKDVILVILEVVMKGLECGISKSS